MEDNKRHILVIPSWYPKDADDISGSFFREQAIALSKYGHTVGVINPQHYSFRNTKETLQTKYGLNIINDSGVRTIRFNYLNLTPRVDFLIKYLWIKLGLYLFEIYLKKFGKPDIIHVHSMINAGYLASEIYKKYNIPYIITEHSNSYENKSISGNEFEKLNEVVDSSKFNIAVSEKFCELLNHKFSNKKWYFIPNIVNNDFIEHEIVIKKEDFIFLSVGNLNKNKSIDILLEAFSNLNTKAPDIKLRVIGDGAEKPNLIKLAKKLGIDKNVEFLGGLSRDQVKIEMSNASALVHSSRYETFGVVIIEALAMGLPVVATRCGGPESIVVPEVGYLVEKNSVESLVWAMKELYKNRLNYSAEDIRQYCILKFSEHVVAQSLTIVYRNILNDSNYINPTLNFESD